MPEQTGGRPALLSVPFPLVYRNFVCTGLAGALADGLGLQVHLVSPAEQPVLGLESGVALTNHHVAATPGPGGLPLVEGVSGIDRALKSVHLTGFAVEYPEGSLQNLTLSRRHNLQWVIARAITWAAPRQGARRAFLRRAYGRFRPRRPWMTELFDRVSPRVVVAASPGHFWLDHFVLDEARRRGIPSVCIVLSWDNLYSRGPLCRRPDILLVWSEEMRRQAIEVHQFPESRVGVVGALQFSFYDEPVSAVEIAEMRRRVGLRAEEPFLAYVCGARTSEYDVEDILAMLQVLGRSRFGALRVVVRPHPQGNRASYERLVSEGVLLDRTLDITSSDARLDAFDRGAIRHMAALLREARFVVSSWGTTALLEASILDTPAVQLRWMDSVSHQSGDQVEKVRDFQRYLHMRPFDACGARPYCDNPSDLVGTLEDLERNDAAYRTRRRQTVSRLVAEPLGDVVSRVVDEIARLGVTRDGPDLALVDVIADPCSRPISSSR